MTCCCRVASTRSSLLSGFQMTCGVGTAADLCAASGFVPLPSSMIAVEGIPRICLRSETTRSASTLNGEPWYEVADEELVEGPSVDGVRLELIDGDVMTTLL